MFLKSSIRKILVISLSNIGDVVLTFPVIDILRQDFPDAQLSVVVGPKAKGLLNNNPYIHHLYIYDKHQPPIVTIRWIIGLFKERFDLVVDLRNSAVPLMVFPRFRTTILDRKQERIHRRKKHLNRLLSVYPSTELSKSKYCLYSSKEDIELVDGLLKNHLRENLPFVVMAPGAAHHAKRWNEEGFAHLADYIVEQYKWKVVFIGSDDDKKIANKIILRMRNQALNLCGQTSLAQTAEIIRRSGFAIVNDSAPMHMASYLDIPTLAFFGPSNPVKYGPWSKMSRFLIGRRESAQEPDDQLIHKISVGQVLESFEIKDNRVIFK